MTSHHFFKITGVCTGIILFSNYLLAVIAVMCELICNYCLTYQQCVAMSEIYVAHCDAILNKLHSENLIFSFYSENSISVETKTRFSVLCTGIILQTS